MWGEALTRLLAMLLSCAEVVGSAGEDMTGGQADDQISVWACIIAVVTLFEPGCALDSIIA